MKKTQFSIGLLAVCLIGASSTFSSVASAQSCGAESCDSTCKCSKKQCNDTGLLEVINSAASNFEAGLASMIPDGSRLKAKSKSACKCKQCCSASHDHSHSHNQAHSQPLIEAPMIYEPAHSSPIPHISAPHDPSYAPAPAPAPVPTPIPAPNLLPDTQSNPFIDEGSSHTRNLRAVPVRSASQLRSTRSPAIQYDPQASANPPLRSILTSQAASRSVSDSAFGLATSRSTRKTLTSSIDDRGSFEMEARRVRDIEVAASEVELTAPEVVPASVSVPIPRLSPVHTTESTATSTGSSVGSYFNPLRP